MRMKHVNILQSVTTGQTHRQRDECKVRLVVSENSNSETVNPLRYPLNNYFI